MFSYLSITCLELPNFVCRYFFGFPLVNMKHTYLEVTMFNLISLHIKGSYLKYITQEHLYIFLLPLNNTQFPNNKNVMEL